MVHPVPNSKIDGIKMEIGMKIIIIITKLIEQPLASISITSNCY
jgi:hypothetical protein